MGKTVSVSLPEPLLRQLDEIARDESRSRSELMREAARMYIELRCRWKDIFMLGNEVRRKRRITPALVVREIEERRKRV
ncbi:MAG: ribbon-helix-helix protein, CopG family [Phycisphaerae bacterium]|nr:ribbon-helix-helix protein, CopG family [Phycisphaerae bacterium]